MKGKSELTWPDREKVVAECGRHDLRTVRSVWKFLATAAEKMKRPDLELAHGTVRKIYRGLQVRRDSLRTFADGLGVGLEELEGKPPTMKSRPLKVAVLGNAAVSYLRDIEFGLRSYLVEHAGRVGRYVEYYSDAGPADPFEEETSRVRWGQVASKLLSEAGPSGYDYLVGLGTIASRVLRDVLDKDYGARPLCFLGVTDPQAAGLVNKLAERDESPQVTGVYYGGGNARDRLAGQAGIPGEGTCLHVPQRDRV